MSDSAGVPETIARALTKKGYDGLTPVQEAVLTEDADGRDALVSAQTGSGKTVAFGLAMASNLLGNGGKLTRRDVPVALIIAPTRELALQVKTELEWLYEFTGARLASCVGGMDMRTERRALDRGANIVVGTPGRLRDHIERGSLDTSGLEVAVLDEADEMLDMGFRDDLEYILDTTPETRRTLLFSATVPKSIAEMAKRYQKDAMRISTVAEREQHSDIEYRVLSIAPNDRENAIINVLRYYEPANAIVFCATRLGVEHMAARLTNRGFAVVALSGDLNQNARSRALQSMRDGRAQICVATDVAARGIDLPNLELVVHADIPRMSETLLHRSGRTGRAGNKGVSALIAPHNWRKRTERLLQNAKLKATWAKPPSAEEVQQKDRERFLNDPSLGTPETTEETPWIDELVGKYDVRQLAAALVRQGLSKRPAPEELLDRPEEARQKGPREDFGDGKWFAISVGRDHSAEPRWLLPMLCRNGHITKKDIGAIRIKESETFVEIAAKSVDRFLENIGPDKVIEKNVTLRSVDGPPEGGGDSGFGGRKRDGKPPQRRKGPPKDKKTGWAAKKAKSLNPSNHKGNAGKKPKGGKKVR